MSCPYCSYHKHFNRFGVLGTSHGFSVLALKYLNNVLLYFYNTKNKELLGRSTAILLGRVMLNRLSMFPLKRAEYVYAIKEISL